MLQQEAIKRNLEYLEEASEEVYRLIIQKLHSESKGFKSLKQHLEMATINTHVSPTMLSSDSGLISLVVARLGSPETLVSGFFENGLLHKLEVDTTSYREATLLPGCVQQSLAAYVTEVRRLKKIVPQKIFLTFYSTGPDWENDGVSYFPSYHLILMDYDEELAKPNHSIKREWQEAWMEEKEVQKRKALSMKIIVETLRYIFRDSCPYLKIYAISSRILMLGKRIYGNNRHGWDAFTNAPSVSDQKPTTCQKTMRSMRKLCAIYSPTEAEIVFLVLSVCFNNLSSFFKCRRGSLVSKLYLVNKGFPPHVMNKTPV
ncbi:hypothetical protein D5086_008108 [Populus alba]|uniref:Uncharacterized protein n=1 Tax=Populus alba TaxID=43335 RepID=A0ACC4CF60_POPAL